MSTLENNVLIAEFMDVTRIENGSYDLPQFGRVFARSYKTEYTAQELKYHSSWDWLMPVLKKINLKLTPQNYDEWRMISKPTEYTIESVHNQAVQFIKWYNENK